MPNILYIITCVRQETTRTEQTIEYARVAQLVELPLAKEEVAGSSPVSRSQENKKEISGWISSFFVFEVQTGLESLRSPFHCGRCKASIPRMLCTVSHSPIKPKEVSRRIYFFVFEVQTGLESSRFPFHCSRCKANILGKVGENPQSLFLLYLVVIF